MILLMKRHPSRPDSSVIPFKRRVPTDIVERARGRRFTVELPATATDPADTFSVVLGEFCKGSLRTRDRRTADLRALAVITAFATFCDALRRGPVELSQRQIEALAGETHKLLVDEHGENPGTEREWESFKALTRACLEGRIAGAPPIPDRGRTDDEVLRVALFGDVEGDALTAAVNGLAPSPDRRALEQRVGRLAYWVLGRHGIEVDDETRFRLLRRIAVAALQAGWQLKANAAGDYRPDPTADRFPRFEAKGVKAAGITLTDLFDRWARETKPSGSTLTTWRGIKEDFIRHLGHEDAAAVSDKNVVEWKDTRVAAGRAAKTINDSDLACLRALFRFGLANKLLTTNPAEGVKVSVKKRAGQGRLPYSTDEIALLLAYAECETSPVRRWMTLLLVTTGARVGEIAQLSAERVRIDDGVPVLRIEPAEDGGSLKNEGSERTVPLHPAVIESGFLDYVREKGRGPLFYGKSRGRGEGRHASKGVTNRFSEWVRGLEGFDNPRKAPSHSVRHWWKTTAAKIGMLDSVADHLQGHADGGPAGGYRHHNDLHVLAAAVETMPYPRIEIADGAMLAGAGAVGAQPQTPTPTAVAPHGPGGKTVTA